MNTPDTPVPYWPAYLPAPADPPVDYQLTELAEHALEAEAGS